MMSRLGSLLALVAIVAGSSLGAACKRDAAPCPPPAPAPASAAPAAAAPGPAAAADCGALVGANPVQTEMRRMECALQRAIAAIGRDELPVIAEQLHIVHAAKEATASAIAAGTWKPATGEVAAFVAMDEAFHAHLGALVEASMARDPAATAAAMGQVLGACHGCHAVYRPVAPAAAAPPAAPHGH